MAALGFVTTLRNSRLDQITSAVGTSGLIRIYDGTQPATGGTATTLLAELTCSTTFAPAASGGILTANGITSDSSANATGTATWGRLTTSGGTAVADFTAGTSGTSLILTTASIVATQPVSISTFVITEGNA
jgi:hypothetical protein